MIVVTGATGNVGRTLVRTLAAAGHAVTAVSRHIQDADVPAGVRAVAADLGTPAGLDAALQGAKALFLLVAGDDPTGVLATAKAAGVTRVVLVSSQGVGTRPGGAYAHVAGFEQAVAASGLDYTILRSGGLDSNAFAWVEPIRAQRLAPAPFAEVGLPFVDPDDVAAVAAAVLTEDGHASATYVLTGPAPTTPRERAAAIAEAIGAPVTFVEMTREEAQAQMAQFVPPEVLEGTLAILGEPTAEEQTVSPDVERILGRPAAPFSAWATRNAPAFR
ncbi:NmrA family protein [Catenulispora acidiphila DSM 44928]|uniref:NmrA family protein n=1 Tax=Catenulispora acidiphila (strain DSM 44928 / JCM 14897 / NBRC 102108 / NRRL B-24433 / ID139908) TaxID=479433 RepID=C7QFY9_CATAD|nr:NAD(P)H-binding protein [Catenulispora acidiphila]ACU70966.1 NmrA family protein [Catenulispora acidiphila DSM 44928]